MKATEQLAAMEMMAVDPIARVIAPRFWAGVISMPLLAAMFSAMGVFGGYLVGVRLIGVDAGSFWSQMQAAVDFREDILNGVIKSVVFGIAVTWIAVFEGYDAPPTAEGVSGATTRTVVTSSLVDTRAGFHSDCINVSRGLKMMKRNALDLWVGVFVAIGLGALLFLALKVGNLGSFSAAKTYLIKANFDNIGGLKKRAPVKSAGVVVGRVEDIGFDTKTYEAAVTMSIDSRYEFPKDTSAKILTSGLLGEQYVGLSAGGDTAMLKDGDTLKITQSAVVLENLISQFLFSKAADGNSGSGNGNNNGKDSK